MNVTSHGYYTTQYLDQYRIKPRIENTSSSRRTNLNDQDVSPSTDKMQAMNSTVKLSDYLRVPSSSAKPQLRRKAPSSSAPMSNSSIASRATSSSEGTRNLSSAHVALPTSENTAKTPAQTRPSSRLQSHAMDDSAVSTPKSKSKAVFSPISKLTREIARKDLVDLDYDDTASNPDHLEQEITPAQLNIIQSHQRDAEIKKQLQRRKKYMAKNQQRVNQQPDIIHGKSMQLYHRKADEGGTDEHYNSDHGDSSGNDSDYSSFYYDYDDNKSPAPKASSRANTRSNQDKRNKKYDYSDYYVLEKKKFDESPFKPKMYSHKTFKTVFQNKNENLDRYNPIDMVFQDSENSDAKDQKLKTAFKTFQSKIGKSNYNDYDYYTQKKKDAEARAARRQNAKLQSKQKSAEVFDTNASDDSDDEALFAGLPDETKRDIKSGKDYKKVWKKKLKVLKKELGQDYIKRYHENLTEKERLKLQRLSKNSKDEPASYSNASPVVTLGAQAPPSGSPKNFSNKLEELDDEDDAAISSDSGDDPGAKYNANSSSQKNYGPNPEFNPIWNYVLSWLVYESASPGATSSSHKHDDDMDYDSSDFSDVDDDAFQAKAKSVSGKASTVKAPSTHKSSTKKLQKKNPGMKLNLNGIRKNYKTMVSTWNQPASALFTGDLTRLDEGRQREMQAAVAALAASENPNFNSKQSTMRSLMSLRSEDGENPLEIEIEVESDFDDVEELFYNPVTKGLDYNPPTSIDSMDVGMANKRGSASSTMSRSFKSPFVLSSQNGPSAASRAKELLNTNGSPQEIISNVNLLIKSFPYMKIIFAPIDVIGENFPTLQTFILIIELVVFIWMFYEITKLINALCLAVQAICAPMIAVGRLMNRIM